MSGSARITMPVLAERLDNHARAFEEERDRARQADQDLAEKVDTLGHDMNAGLVGVHKRVDAFHRCALRNVAALAGSIIMILLGLLGYLLINGAPWQ